MTSSLGFKSYSSKLQNQNSKIKTQANLIYLRFLYLSNPKFIAEPFLAHYQH